MEGTTAAELGWKEVHAALEGVARKRAEADWEEAALILHGLRTRVYVHLGFGSYLEYLERLFGYGPKVAGERLRVAQALVELPATGRALREATLTWSAVKEVTRVAVPKTEEEWVRVCKDKTVRQIEELVAGLRPGDLPTDPPRDEARKHVVRFEVQGETFALLRDARGALEREAGHSLSDDDFMMMLARRTLGGPTDEGRASYQIALTVCEDCGKGRQTGHGVDVAVAPEVVEMAKCDAQNVGNPHVGEPGRATQTIPPAIRRQVMRRDGGRCVVPGCRSAAYIDLDHLKARHEGGVHDPDQIVCLCGAHHRAKHRGFLMIEGTVSTGLRFFHADGTTYGGEVSPAAAEVSTLTFQALKKMGYADGEARRGVEAARPHVGEGLVGMLRGALGALAVGEEEASYGEFAA